MADKYFYVIKLWLPYRYQKQLQMIKYDTELPFVRFTSTSFLTKLKLFAFVW